jgi:hypothetical protein
MQEAARHPNLDKRSAVMCRWLWKASLTPSRRRSSPSREYFVAVIRVKCLEPTRWYLT